MSCPAPQFKSINSLAFSFLYDILGHAKEIKFLFLTVDVWNTAIFCLSSLASLPPSLLPSLILFSFQSRGRQTFSMMTQIDLVGLTISVTTTQFCRCSMISSHRQYVTKWMWLLSSNKILFVKKNDSLQFS